MMEEDKASGSESTIINKRGQKLFCKTWSPADNKPSKLVFICHGFGEHLQRYIPMINQLVQEGFFVFAHDHVGHGKSEGERVDIENFKYFVDDVVQHVTEVKKNFPEIPCFVVGHSMGGAITSLTCLDHPDLFKGAVLIGPALAINKDLAPTYKKVIAKAVAWMFPQLQIGYLVPDHYTRDKQEVAKILEDPLCWHGGAKARMSTRFMQGMDEIESRRSEFKVPYLLIHGTDDLLCEIIASEEFHKLSVSTDKTFTPYEGAYHQVHYEPEGQGDKCISQVVTWISSK